MNTYQSAFSYFAVFCLLQKCGARPQLDGDGLGAKVQCECVPPHLCADNDDSVNGDGLLDIRFQDDLCPSYHDVCCDMPIKYAPKETRSCGMQMAADISPRITSDSEVAQFGELPWTILMLQSDRKEEGNAFICGGSLIHPQVVITAGHCVSGSKNTQIKIRAGEWNIRNNKEPLPHQDNFVQEVLVHPLYKSGILWNDIALLFLSKPFAEAANIGFICLPPQTGLDIDSSKCVAAGWGKNVFERSSHSSHRPPSVLRKVTLPIVPTSKCLSALKRTRLGKSFRLHRSFICAGGEKKKDTCKGDGGSPLICPTVGETPRFVQMGIVSWGIKCGVSKTPGVYVNLPLYTEWIDNQMARRNYTTDFYKI